MSSASRHLPTAPAEMPGYGLGQAICRASCHVVSQVPTCKAEHRTKCMVACPACLALGPAPLCRKTCCGHRPQLAQTQCWHGTEDSSCVHSQSDTFSSTMALRAPFCMKLMWLSTCSQPGGMCYKHMRTHWQASWRLRAPTELLAADFQWRR